MRDRRCSRAPTHRHGGDLVLDAFNGSGTTGVACLERGRRLLGIELSGDFAERARHRLAGTTPGLALVT